MKSFARALAHFLVAGLLTGVLGVAVSALVFYLTVLGLLHAEQPVHGSAQVSIELPQLAGVALTPPIRPVDLAPPPDKQPRWLDADYLRDCFGLLRSAVARDDLAWTMAAWAGTAALLAMAVGLLGATVRSVSGAAAGPFVGVLALLAAVAAGGVLIAHFQYQVVLPFDIDALGRLVLYAGVAALNLLWISIVGFRLRALLYTLATVLTGEALVLGFPPEAWTTTALWHACLFLCVPAGYGWLAVERGELKKVIT